MLAPTKCGKHVAKGREKNARKGRSFCRSAFVASFLPITYTLKESVLKPPLLFARVFLRPSRDIIIALWFVRGEREQRSQRTRKVDKMRRAARHLCKTTDALLSRRMMRTQSAANTTTVTTPRTTTTTTTTAAFVLAAMMRTKGGPRRTGPSRHQKKARCFASSASQASSSKVPLEQEIPLLATTTFVGIAVASFWRGAWYVLDETVFPSSELKSGMACFLGGVSGLATSQHVKLMMMREHVGAATRSARKRVMLFSPPTYFVGLSCVLFWRGVWCLWDSATDAYFSHRSSSSSSEKEEEENVSSSYSPKLKSGILSHAFGATALVSTGFLASAACPPAGLWVARDAATAVRVARLAALRR